MPTCSRRSSSAAAENFANCLTQIVGETEAWTERLADTVLKDTSRFDIIVLNEAWDQAAKDILVQRLGGPQDYPTYVRHIGADLISVRGATDQAILSGMDPAAAVAIYGLPLVKINGEDSGLMLFASPDFEFLPLPDPTHRWGDQPGEALDAQTGEVGFLLYEACGSDDCLAAKGVALARLRHKPSGRNYTIVFTHMQADYFDDGEVFPDERRAQFDQVVKLIETTLGPLTSSEREQERILLMGDLNVPNFHIPQPPPAITEWDSLFNDAGSYFTDRMYEAWARTTSPADQGITNFNDGERFDYIVASPRRYESGGLEGPVCVQHMTVPTDFVALESDHNMVHADLNVGFYHCHPQIAYPVKLEKVAFGGKPIEHQIVDNEDGTDVTWIAFPGSMQWFHVRKEPGTYTIGTRSTGSDPHAVAFDVYLPTDLTTPISRYYDNGKTILVREQEIYTETFVLPDEFYVRTRGREPGFVGDYFLYVKRHTCATKDDACALQPDQPQSATLTKANSLFGTQDEAWFEFDVVGLSDSGPHQTIRLEAAGLPDASNFKAGLDDFIDTDGSGPPPEQVLGTSRVLVGPDGAGVHRLPDDPAGLADRQRRTRVREHADQPAHPRTRGPGLRRRDQPGVRLR